MGEVDPRAAAYAQTQAEAAIQIQGGELHTLADALEQRLCQQRECGIYQRDGGLVEIAMVPTNNTDLIQRGNDAPVIVPVNGIRLRDLGTRHGEWQSWDARKDAWKRANCPKDVAETLANRSTWQFPVLVSVLGAPTIDRAGNILADPGYHPDTGVYLHIDGWDLPKKNPKHADAVKSRELLEDLVSEFPFVDASARATWLACLLTALVRWDLRTAPLFGFDAPVMSSGKTLLASLIGQLIYGRDPAAMKQPRDKSEEEKAIMAALMHGDPLLLLDNVSYTLSSDLLCIIATSEKLRGRVLGATKMVDASTKITMMLTGNNLSVKGDLSTRILLTRLDAGIERPEERSFQRPDIRAYAKAQRQELVNAALTILRAYHLAGRPAPALPPYGRFEDWSDRIRAPLVWAGAEDPCKTRERIEVNDPDREGHEQFLRAFYAIYGTEKKLVKQVLQDVSHQKDAILAFPEEQISELREAVMGIGHDNRPPTSQQLSKKMLSWEGRLNNGLRIIRWGKYQGSVAWRVEDKLVSVVSVEGVFDRNAEITQKSESLQGRDGKASPAPPHSPNDPEALRALMTVACAGLAITAEELAARMDAADLEEVAAGRITPAELREWAVHFANETGGEQA